MKEAVNYKPVCFIYMWLSIFYILFFGSMTAAKYVGTNVVLFVIGMLTLYGVFVAVLINLLSFVVAIAYSIKMRDKQLIKFLILWHILIVCAFILLTGDNPLIFISFVLVSIAWYQCYSFTKTVFVNEEDC